MTKRTVLLLVSLTFLTFLPILWNDFVTWDDGLLITENPIVREFSLRTVHRAFTSYDPELYIPLTFLSYQIDHAIGGLHPFMFHLTNLILHTLNAILVFWLIILLRIPSPIAPHPNPLPVGEGNNGHYLVALTTALLWAVHPLNTEAVAWAAARKDVLSGFFFLLALCGYLKWREGVMVRDFAAAKSSRTMTQYWYWFSAFSFLFGLLAKVSIAPLPIILLLIDWWQGRRMDRGTISEKTPYVLLSIVFGIVALGGKHGNTGLLWEKALIGAKATIFYIGRLLWPTGFSVLYPYTWPITWSNPDLLLPLLLILSLSACAFLLRKRSPSAACGWAFFLLMLLPSFTNFAKGHDQLRDVYFASDRYVYLPSIGIFLLIGSLLCHKNNPLSHWERVRVRGTCGILVCMLSLLAFLSYHQSLVWRNTETLFQNVIRHYPDSHIAWNNLGSIALEHGDAKTALEDYDRSLTIRPNAAALFNLGQIALQKGLTSEAMELYRRAILSRPNDRDAHVNLGVLLLREGKLTEAAAIFQQAIAIDDTFATAHFNLGLALEELGDRDGARQAYSRVLELDPSDQEARKKMSND